MLKSRPWMSIAVVMLLGAVQAEAARIDGKVRNLLVQPGLYGGCAAIFWDNSNDQNIQNPKDQENSCDINWLSADCDGVVSSKSEGNSIWSMVQLAAVTDRTVAVFFDGVQPLNGKCRIKRIDLVPITEGT